MNEGDVEGQSKTEDSKQMMRVMIKIVNDTSREKGNILKELHKRENCNELI